MDLFITAKMASRSKQLNQIAQVSLYDTQANLILSNSVSPYPVILPDMTLHPGGAWWDGNDVMEPLIVASLQKHFATARYIFYWDGLNLTGACLSNIISRHVPVDSPRPIFINLYQIAVAIFVLHNKGYTWCEVEPFNPGRILICNGQAPSKIPGENLKTLWSMFCSRSEIVMDMYVNLVKQGLSDYAGSYEAFPDPVGVSLVDRSGTPCLNSGLLVSSDDYESLLLISLSSESDLSHYSMSELTQMIDMSTKGIECPIKATLIDPDSPPFLAMLNSEYNYTPSETQTLQNYLKPEVYARIIGAIGSIGGDETVHSLAVKQMGMDTTDEESLSLHHKYSSVLRNYFRGEKYDQEPLMESIKYLYEEPMLNSVSWRAFVAQLRLMPEETAQPVYTTYLQLLDELKNGNSN